MKPFERLKKKNRACFILYLAEFTYREMAELLDISERTVARYISTAQEEYPELRMTEA